MGNGGIYTGATTDTLVLNNPPSTMYGYLYRCAITNGTTTNSTPVTLQFSQTWTEAVNTAWENPGNWSCGILPIVTQM